MRRKMIYLLAGGLCLSQVAFADTESRLSDLERQMDQIRVVTPNETCGIVTGLARPVLDECDGCCGENWWIGLEALFWHAKVGDTQYAYTDLSGTAFDKGRIKQMDFEWDWGLKVDVGYNFAHDGWDLHGQYTWYDTGASDRVSTPGQTQFTVPLRGFPAIDDTGDLLRVCKKAQSQFELHFQAVNLELGREFYVSEWLSLHPYFGLKAAFFELEQNTRYYGGPKLGNNTYHVQDEHNFWGVGPTAGMDANFHLGKGFSLYGDFSADMVYGKMDVEYRDRFSLSNDQRRIRFNRHAFIPALEFMLGLQYDKYFWEDEKHLRLRFSYESQYWFNMNQMLQTYTLGPVGPNTPTEGGVERYLPYSEDLSFHGFTFEVRVDF